MLENNKSKHLKKILTKESVGLRKSFRNSNKCCCLLTSSECMKNSKCHVIHSAPYHSLQGRDSDLKSFVKVHNENGLSACSNKIILQDNTNITGDTKKCDNQNDELNKKCLQSNTKLSNNTNAHSITNISGVSETTDSINSEKRDIETNTEKGIPYRNLPNTSIIRIKSQGTTTRGETDDESDDILSLLGKNLMKQNLPCVNIKPALSKQAGPTVHIPAVSKFTTKKERNKNVIVKEFVHESCWNTADDEIHETTDELESRVNNVSSPLKRNCNKFKENNEIRSSPRNDVYVSKRSNVVNTDDIDINVIQERLRSVVKFYSEKLLSNKDKRITFSHQQLIKTLNLLNDSIMKLYDNQMNQYLNCGRSTPLEPPLSYRMKTVTDLLWEELDIRSHPTDEHCVQIDQILQYLVEDIKNVILKKTIINRMNSKNLGEPPQNVSDTIEGTC